MARSSIILILLLLATNLFGQSNFQGYFTSSAGYETNPFIINNAKPSAYMRNSFGIGYFPDSSNFAASYTALLTNLLEYPENNYHLHRIKTDYAFQPFNNENLSFSAGAQAKLRLNASDAEFYDYLELSPELIVNYDAGFGLLSLGYQASLNSFMNYKDLTNFTNEIFVSCDYSPIETVNTYLSVTYGIKKYDNIENVIPSTPQSPAVKGKGKMYKRNGNNQSNQAQPHIVYSSFSSQIIDLQCGSTISVNDDINFGLDLNANYHPIDDGMYLSSGATDIFGDINMFDDLYNFDEKAITLSANYQALENLQISGSFRYFDRSFLYALALIDDTYSTDISRSDYGNSLRLDAKYRSSWLNNLSFKLSIGRIINTSNSNEYTFESLGTQLSATLDF